MKTLALLQLMLLPLAGIADVTSASEGVAVRHGAETTGETRSVWEAVGDAKQALERWLIGISEARR